MLATLENMEISGNLLIVENSGNLKYILGIFVYQINFFVTQSVTHNKSTCKFARLQWYLCELLVVVYGSIDWLWDTVTGMGGASYHAP